MTFVIGSLLALSSLSPSSIYAQETEQYEDIKLFVQEDCGYCEEVLDFIEENSLEEELNIQILEVSNSEANSIAFDTAAEICGVNANYVPMIYVDGECTSNSISVIEKLGRIAGINTDTSEKTPEKDESGTSAPEEGQPEEADDSSTHNPESEGSTLSDALETPTELVDIPWYAYVMIPAAISCLIAIAYLVITKLKV